MTDQEHNTHTDGTMWSSEDTEVVSDTGTMAEVTCFSYPLHSLMDVTSSVFMREAAVVDTDITGAKTFDLLDSFSNVNDPEPIKFDVCVTALFLVPLLLIPNLINQNVDAVSLLIITLYMS